jgi:hypothetical protein
MSSLPLDTAFEKLRQVRTGLLRLHKALLDTERIAYERHHGRIKSTGAFFQLVISDEWFDWLRPMSQFIVEIDEAVGNKKQPITLEQANELLEQAQALLRPDENGTPQQQRYYQAIQANPRIAMMNGELSKVLKG